ncbi:MAG: tryptophan--tRNA ligase [Endomicrobiales bacterium]|nr:tryptophan--tRNA ligase [Endomicrobiales bacterium]
MKKKILSGMRPSGKLHLGHLFGALNNWIKLQDEYKCFYMVADWHALTTDYANTSEIEENVREMVIDWLASGLDPKKSVIFRQSEITEHAELFLLLGMATPLGWLLRCPTYKEQLREIENKDLHTFGFLGYPVLQAADILLYKANSVPVGEDQLPHLELTREICRRFNNFYGEIFPEPQPILTKSARVPGIDARKMSKSYGNAIALSEEPESIKKKVQQMFTDPKKMRANDPGHPEGCVVFAFHQIYNPDHKTLEDCCKKGQSGCVDCKRALTKMLIDALEPLREKRMKISKDKKLVNDILEDGRIKAGKEASATMKEVRKSVFKARVAEKSNR